MNSRSIDVIKEIYKPTRVTIKGNALLLESTSGNVVVKEKKNDLRNLYDYLSSRSFSYYPPLLDDSREGVNIFSYVKKSEAPKEQDAVEMIKLVGLLHQKTTYYKEVTSDEYKKLYEEIKAQIDYVRYFFENVYDEAFKSIYPSPSEYFLLTNISKILASLNYSETKLESWYQLTYNLNRYRICQIHNNLDITHYHDDCLLSWEHSRKDSPVVDIVNFYKKSCLDLDFDLLLQEYLRICPWSKEEQLLFNIVISIPPKFDTNTSEYLKVKNICKTLDYIYKTERLVGPDDSVEQKD